MGKPKLNMQGDQRNPIYEPLWGGDGNKENKFSEKQEKAKRVIPE